MQNRRKKVSELMLIWIAFRIGFHRKLCARGVFVRMFFFSNLLTVSWRRDPRSARAGAVETQFLNLRVTAYQMYFRHFCSVHFVKFGPYFLLLEHMYKQGQIKTRNVIKFGVQNRSQKSVFLWLFRRLVSKVRQGGLKCPFWCLWVVPKVTPVSPGTLKMIENGVP